MHVFIRAASPWLNEPLEGFIREHVPESIFYDDFDDFPADARTVFKLDALARKSYLSRVVEYWTAKRPGSMLKTHFPPTVCLSLDYAEYVDEALTAANDLSLYYSLGENENRPREERDWWILKPALVDCGAGIRLFSTVEELASHLELAGDEVDDDENEDEDEDEQEMKLDGKPMANEKPGHADEFSPTLSAPGLNSLDGLFTAIGHMEPDAARPGVVRAPPKKQPYVFRAGGRIPSSEMREFVAQRYVAAIAPLEKRKWHIRAYVLSVGRLKVHVFREMLILLALKNYEPPWLNPRLTSSLTNTALQDEEDFVRSESMRDFWEAPDDLIPGSGAGDGRSWKDRVFDQICGISSELFRAAAHTMADKFTTLDRCFELFSVDFLVDLDGNAWLLEVNETPAFYQQDIAGPLSLRLMESVILVALEHMGLARRGDERDDDARKRMIEVLDETDKLARSNITEIMPEE